MFNMKYRRNTELILQLFGEDLEDLDGYQKRKQVAGNLAYLELIIVITKDETLAAQASIQDRILAISTGTTIATDQNILMSIKNDHERFADQDHRYAIVLDSDGCDTPHLSTWNKFITDNHNSDTVSTVMADIMNRVSQSDNSGNEEGPSRSTPSPKAKISGMKCAACLEHDDTGSLL